jgi:hypothetical protein
MNLGIFSKKFPIILCMLITNTHSSRLNTFQKEDIWQITNLELVNSSNFRARYMKSSSMVIMFETRVNLGCGIIKNLSSILIDEQGVPIENIWDTIEEFGIRREELKKLDPTYKELFEIYSAIRAYRVSVRYLKQLKTRFA